MAPHGKLLVIIFLPTLFGYAAIGLHGYKATWLREYARAGNSFTSATHRFLILLIVLIQILIGSHQTMRLSSYTPIELHAYAHSQTKGCP